jgi:predicted Zn finger-like uncharacterized protein
MIIQCQGCAAKYFLPQDKVPENPIKVSCPKCTAVFTLVPQHEPVTAGTTGAPVVEEPAVRESAAVEPAVQEPTAAEPAVEEPAVEEPAAATTAAEPAKTDPQNAPGPIRGRSKDDRAKRLARVLVSDILCYNQEKRDQALEDGTLMTVLGEEIKKSWELYKEKVGADKANSTNYFKEALNEILADGQEVF